MACENAFVNIYKFRAVSEFIQTLKKLKITKLQYLRLKAWNWESVDCLLSDADFKDNVIQDPFCIELVGINEGSDNCSATNKIKMVSKLIQNGWGKKIKVKYEDQIICNKTTVTDDDEVWDLCEEPNNISHYCN